MFLGGFRVLPFELGFSALGVRCRASASCADRCVGPILFYIRLPRYFDLMSALLSVGVEPLCGCHFGLSLSFTYFFMCSLLALLSLFWRVFVASNSRAEQTLLLALRWKCWCYFTLLISGAYSAGEKMEANVTKPLHLRPSSAFGPGVRGWSY